MDLQRYDPRHHWTRQPCTASTLISISSSFPSLPTCFCLDIVDANKSVSLRINISSGSSSEIVFREAFFPAVHTLKLKSGPLKDNYMSAYRELHSIRSPPVAAILSNSIKSIGMSIRLNQRE